MDKFFEVLKKIRPAVQEGKITRERAIDILMQESGVSEQLASKAADNMLSSKPEVPGGITSIEPEVTFTPTQKKLPEPDDPSVEERTGGLLKEGRDYKIGEDGEYISLRDQDLSSLRNEIMRLGDKDAFEYDMALFRQKKRQRMEKVYKQFGAVSETDKKLIDEYIEVDENDKVIFTPSNPKYDKATASIFIQESLEGIAGAEDLARDILYGRVAENILADEGLDAYIDYAAKELKKEGLEFNVKLLKKLLKEKPNIDAPEPFQSGGRVGFKEGVGKKGIMAALVDKLNEIAPGSTAVGKTTKVSEKAARKKAEKKMFEDFMARNKLTERDRVRKEMKEKYGFTDERLDEIENTPVDEEMADRLIAETDQPPPGSRGGDEDIAAPFNVEDSKTMDSFMEFVKKTDPEGYAKMQKIADQINEAIEAANKRADAMEELEALKKKGRKLNAGGGLNYLMGL